jgi:hypothetical protein
MRRIGLILPFLLAPIVALWLIISAIGPGAVGQVVIGNTTQCIANASAAGTADVITIPALPCALTTNLLILTASAANATTTPTLQPLGLAAQTIIRANGSALAAGDIPGSGAVVLLTPNGTNWILLNPATALITAGQGLTSNPSGVVSSNAFDHFAYAPGVLNPASMAAKVGFFKIGKASTVDNIVGSASEWTCSTSPQVNLWECGVSTTCASSPVQMGNVTVGTSGSAFTGTVSSPAITAGDFVAFSVTPGTCSLLDIQVGVQVHAN